MTMGQQGETRQVQLPPVGAERLQILELEEEVAALNALVDHLRGRLREERIKNASLSAGYAALHRASEEGEAPGDGASDR